MDNFVIKKNTIPTKTTVKKIKVKKSNNFGQTTKDRKSVV